MELIWEQKCPYKSVQKQSVMNNTVVLYMHDKYLKVLF